MEKKTLRRSMKSEFIEKDLNLEIQSTTNFINYIAINSIIIVLIIYRLINRQEIDNLLAISLLFLAIEHLIKYYYLKKKRDLIFGIIELIFMFTFTWICFY